MEEMDKRIIDESLGPRRHPALRRFGGMKLWSFCALVASATYLHAVSAWIDGPDGSIEILYEVSDGKATVCNTYDRSQGYGDGEYGFWSYWYGEGWEEHHVNQESENMGIIRATFQCAISPEITGDLRMPSKLNGVPVLQIGDNAFHGCTKLTSITISEGVASIGNNAFDGCSALTSISIPATMKSIVSGAFSGSPNTLFDTNTIPGVRLVDGWAIGRDGTLSGELALIGVRGIADSAFQGCASLTTVTISNGVTSIGSSAFEGCSGLTSVTIPDSVTSIGNKAFKGCTSLASVTIPDSVAHIGDYAFEGCTKLTQPVFNQSGTTIRFLPDSFKDSLSGAFVIPDGVTRIWSHAFECCPGLTSVTIPDSVTNIGEGAFAYCHRLASVNISDLAAWCEISFEAHDANPINCSHQLSLNGSEIRNLVIPDGVTEIGDYAFYGCSTLTSVTIPNSVTRIGKGAFTGCSGLTSVSIPNSVTSIGDSAFRNCSGLTSVEVPGSVTSIGKDAFKGCESVSWGNASEGEPTGSTGSGNIVFPEQIVYHAGWPGLVQTRNGNASSPRRELGAVMGFVGSSANGGSYTSPIDGVTTTWAERDSWLYEGEMYMVAGTSYTFGTYIDDYATIDIDDNQILNQPQCRFTTATYQCSQTGWHKISVKIWDTGGGYGNTYGWLGVAYNTVGVTSQFSSAWRQLVDPGDGSLLRTTTKTLAMSGVRVSAQMRESDPTVMDVDYIVYTDPETTPTVNIRALAFEDGERGFATVVRPETFIEGTDANIGDGIAANVEHRLSWKVSSDWAIDLAKVKFEMMAMKPGDSLLPGMHFVTIPAAEGHPKTTVSVNSVSDSYLFNALLWCYADGDPALSLSSGTLRAEGRDLARNGGISNKPNALRYIGEHDGFRLLDNSAERAWINECTRLNLPLNERLVKTIEE